jgi:two-component system response regulator DegU
VIQEIPYRCCLADDDSIFRNNLKRFLTPGGDFSIVGEAGDGAQLMEFLKINRASLPDMAILDVSMPNVGGIAAAALIKNIYPSMKILIMTIHNEEEYLQKALSIGVDGYVLKEDVGAELFSAISKIREGGVYISRNFDHSTGGLK